MNVLVSSAAADGVALVQMHDPATANAVGLRMAGELLGAFEALAADERVRVVVLSGAGENFSSGGNLQDALSESDRGLAGSARFMTAFNALIRAVFHFPKPLISSVRGSAAGGALGLALCTDVILAARSARFMQAFIHVGLAPDCGSSLLLGRRVGVGRAKELTLTGRRVGAQEALDIGLADAVYEDAEIHDRALELARTIAAKAPLGTAQSRQLMQRAQFASLDEALEMEATVQQALLQSQDFREGASAFLQKRPPAFCGK